MVGAEHFTRVIRSIREMNESCTIEILTPDFNKKTKALDILSNDLPDVFNHNLETVPRLYLSIRPGSRYFVSLKLLADIKKLNPKIFTKSGLMVGLGETKDEIYQVMDDLRAADVDFITIGQYLPPTPKHAKLEKFITPKEFEEYKQMAIAKGFLMVSSSPLTRSSYHASEDFRVMQENRASKKLLMKNSKREEIVSHSAKKLFNIVLDIQSYPEYIPWCTKMVVNEKKSDEIYADMYVKYKFILTQKFGSHVKFNKKELTIQTSYLEGPLKDLKTNWKFEEIKKNKSKIIFEVNFEFKGFYPSEDCRNFLPSYRK